MLLKSKVALSGLAVLATWFGLLWQTQERLRSLESELPPITASLQHTLPTRHHHHHHNSNHKKWISPYHETTGEPLRFLVFQGDIPGQGAGNILNGLLAAHLLGDEFERIVCMSPAYDDFLLAFESIHPLAVKHCPRVIQTWEQHMNATHPLKKGRHFSYNKPPRKFLLEFVNFAVSRHPIDECELKRKLASSTPVWYLKSNMYPRWPTNVVPKQYFERFYRPTEDLIELLPTTLPYTVVHLRKEDGARDRRNGLDNATLTALGNYLEGEQPPPYLVTNHVEFYQYFDDRHWSHPPWDNVVHSALLNSNENNQHGGGTQSRRHKKHNHTTTSQDYRNQQKLQLFADWYTLLKANRVLHTFSDFSASAVHWTDPTSQSSLVIRGYNETTQQLDLVVEWWRRDDNAPVQPLVERTTDRMFHCANKSHHPALKIAIDGEEQ